MKTMHPTLLNYSYVNNLHQLANEYGVKIVLSQDGVIHTERMICCEKPCNYNGSNKSGHIVSRSGNSIIKVGQQCCMVCGKTHQVQNEFIKRLKHDLDDMILSEALSLREFHTSYEEIAIHLKRTKGIVISSKTLEYACNTKLAELDTLELDYEIEDGYYCYDEQWITVEGKKMLRVVIFDPRNNIAIYEKVHEQLTKCILEEILREVFKDKAPKGFVFDMQAMYPNAFRRVFGGKIKLQFCIFHLNKLILEEYQSCLRFGKKIMWSLTHYYNLYSLFNIFYDRTQELKLLGDLQKQLSAYKETINLENLSEDIKFPKSCKTVEQKIEHLCALQEKELIKNFKEHLHNEKLRRKRVKETLKVRRTTDAKVQLETLVRQINFYPKKIQERIKRIEENFELFVGSDGEILTNNRLEGFFGSTLQKFRKKGFHSIQGIKNFLIFQKAKYLGVEFSHTFSFQKLNLIFGVISLFQG